MFNNLWAKYIIDRLMYQLICKGPYYIGFVRGIKWRIQIIAGQKTLGTTVDKLKYVAIIVDISTTKAVL